MPSRDQVVIQFMRKKVREGYTTPQELARLAGCWCYPPPTMCYANEYEYDLEESLLRLAEQVLGEQQHVPGQE